MMSKEMRSLQVPCGNDLLMSRLFREQSNFFKLTRGTKLRLDLSTPCFGREEKDEPFSG